MPAYLFVQAGPNSGEIHALGDGAVVVGRGEDCDVPLRDPFVSRQHFRIEREGGEHRLIDLGSRNCTVVNGMPAARKALAHGDEIRLGSTHILFVGEGGGAPASAAEIRSVERTITKMVAVEKGRPPDIVGSTAPMRRVFELIEKAAPVDVTVLVTGESGTGKELVARAIHRLSPRKDGPLVTLNCAAIPRDLVESELFGHEKGAFTGAHSQRLGKFELAQGGTLFLDEVGELPLEGQAKLLRVLEERKVTRVGGSKDLDVDVRIVAATNRDLHAMTQDGRFRLDLVYRLEVVSIDLPPLRTRRDDIPQLAQHFLDHFHEKTGRPATSFARAAVERLRAHAWPGNVRELKNAIERAAIFAPGTMIGPDDIELGRPGPSPASVPAPAPPPAPAPTFAPSLAPTPDPGTAAVASIDDVLKQQIARALEAAGGNKKKAAAMLGIPRSSLYGYLDRFGLR